MSNATARTIRENPQASASKIEAMARCDPDAALQHPNCPVELWWALAANHGMEAPSSPAGQLFLLEAPERWAVLERENIQRWISMAWQILRKTQRYMLVAECAERVLPLYEREFPGDTRIREAINALRQWRLGIETQDGYRLEQAWLSSKCTAEAAAKEAALSSDSPAQGPSYSTADKITTSGQYAARDAAFVLCYDDSEEALHVAARAMGHAKHAERQRSAPAMFWDAQDDDPRKIEFMAAKFAEAKWQWMRIQQYRKEEPA